jgi:hypothetical protein
VRWYRVKKFFKLTALRIKILYLKQRT